MCGIAGIVGQDDGKSTIDRMVRAIIHRGPDGNGTWTDRGIALGHVRLSIIDTSEGGHQPMISGRYVLTYNGEIYNYIEVREELKKLGRTFTSQSDTEVLLQAFEQWGTECLARMEGMWSFAIFDTQARKLFCARDPLGIKPFYYHYDGRRLMFASEIKGLLAAGIPAVANLAMISDYLCLGMTDHSEDTCFDGIRQLAPGMSLIFDLEHNNLKFLRYFDIGAAPVGGLRSFDELFRDTIRLHIRSDVPVGTCLSGGVDSSTVASFAAREIGAVGGRLTAVTAKPEGEHLDETPYASKVAKAGPIDWHVVPTTFEEADRHLEDCLRIQDEPVTSPSVVMQYLVMKKSHELGMKVMLDGQGGDEIFLGYERYYAPFFFGLARRGRLAKLTREWIMASRNSKLSLIDLAKYSLYFGIPAVREARTRRRFAYLTDACLDMSASTRRQIENAFLDLKSVQIAELSKFNLPRLLRYEDRNSMAHAIEARVPFVFPRLVQNALHTPPEQLIVDGFTKYPVRKALSRLVPPEVAWRTHKIGFEAPTNLWLEKRGEAVERVLRASRILPKLLKETSAFERVSGIDRWRLFNVAHWEQTHGIGHSG